MIKFSKLKRAIFLDRDGVIVAEPPAYAYKISELRLIPNSAAAIRTFNSLGFLVIVITNQAGVAKGIFKEEAISPFNQEMTKRLLRNGAQINKIYYCPHHPEAVIPEYKIDCLCRKPKPGMILQAQEEFGINLADSFLIGDKISDIQAAINAGCKPILVKTGLGKEQFQKMDYQIKCLIADNLFQTVNLIT